MKYFINLLTFFILSAPVFSANNLKAKSPSLREKIGQMLLIGFEGKKINTHSPIVKIINNNNIGGVILFDYNAQKKTFDKNIENPRQVKQLTHDLFRFNQLSNLSHHRPNLPLLISVDYEGGEVTRLSEKYGFPPTLSAEKVGEKSIKQADFLAKAMATTLKNSGFNLNFSPLLDVNINPDNPIIGKKGRSFSSNPVKVANYSHVYARNFLKQSIQCAYKHFPGHGSSESDSHLEFVDVSDTWQPYELTPYEQLINAPYSCGMIMTAHIINRQLDESGLPATLSHKVLTDLLRNQLHFNGVIISDDMQMKAISDNYKLEHALVLTINAGTDMIIFGNNLTVKPQDPEQIINIIEAKVLSGEISRKRINDAYRHIVKFKQSI